MKKCAAAFALFVLLSVLLIAGGCSSDPQLMPTPNLYARGDFDPFADVPPALRTNYVDVLYLTDRKPEGKLPDDPKYGYERSRSVAFGVSRVEFGENVSWDELVKASRSSKRDVSLPMHIVKTTEIGRFPPTPKMLIELPPPKLAAPSTQQAVPDATFGAKPTTMRAEREETYAKADRLLSERLAQTPTKDVYIFVHGYANTFADAVTTIAQLWHFFGRQGVPIAYTWPAGHGGLLKGYNYDRESSEFTVYHLKEMIRHVAENPDVHKIHIICHSRGTDVAISALRELHLEISGSGRPTRDVLKLGMMAVCAPDVDFDVMIQRAITTRLGQVPERCVVYVSPTDKAIGLSNWLFGGLMRAGNLKSDVFTKEELKFMRERGTAEIVQVDVSTKGTNFGHDYFHSSPAASSDLILAMRYHYRAGTEYGRPLKVEKGGGFWMIDDSYPTPTTMPASVRASGDSPGNSGK